MIPEEIDATDTPVAWLNQPFSISQSSTRDNMYFAE
jgi:hypothetical protein